MPFRVRMFLPSACLALAAPLLAHASASSGAPSCVRAWPESRARYPGYDHIVHLVNGCTERMACTVTTDVNPQPITVALAPRQATEVLTFMASPARQFTAKVDCSPSGAPPRQ